MENNKELVEKYDIVQIKDKEGWSGCLVLVTTVYEWGIQGFVAIPNQGDAYVRIDHDDYYIIGQSAMIPMEV